MKQCMSFGVRQGRVQRLVQSVAVVGCGTLARITTCFSVRNPAVSVRIVKHVKQKTKALRKH